MRRANARVTSFSNKPLARVAPGSSPPCEGSMITRNRGAAGVGICVGGTGTFVALVAGGFGCAVGVLGAVAAGACACTGAGGGCCAAIVIVLRPSLNVACAGVVVAIVISAEPLASEKLAERIVGLSKFCGFAPPAISGSRLNVRRTRPGSVDIAGFTGAVKCSTRRFGLAFAISAEYEVLTSPTNSRREF